jgi:hypothetical protein
MVALVVGEEYLHLRVAFGDDVEAACEVGVDTRSEELAAILGDEGNVVA